MLNLINRIIENATSRIVKQIPLSDVKEEVVEQFIEELSISDVANEIDLSDLAYELSDSVAREVADSERLTERLVAALTYEEEFISNVKDRLCVRCDEIDDRIDILATRVAALESTPAREATPAPATPEPSPDLVSKMLDLAVDKLLALADEAVRGGRV